MRHDARYAACCILAILTSLALPTSAEEPRSPAPRASGRTEALPESSVPVDPDHPPILHIAPLEFDAGNIVKGEPVKAAFHVENRGAGPLEIVKVAAGCRCTKAVSDSIIEPGRSGRIELTVDTRDLRGSFQKGAVVLTNDPHRRVEKILVRGTITEFLSVSPTDRLTLGAVPPGERREETVTLTAGDGTPFRVTHVSSTDPGLRNEITHAEGGLSASVRIILPESYAAAHDRGMKRVNATLTVQTSHPKVPEVNLEVYGTIRPLVLVSPRRIDFGTLPAEEARKGPKAAGLGKTIYIHNDGAEPLKLTAAECSLDFFGIDVEELKPGRLFKALLSPKASIPPGRFEGEVTFDTSTGTITVPLHGTVGE